MNENIKQRLFFFLVLFLMTLSGFAQMPIFKRYYVADIPGFGWLAQFYVTHLIHYAGAFVLILFAAYFILNFFLEKKQVRFSLNLTGNIQTFLMGVLILTGILMVIKNFDGVFWPHRFIIILDISHLLSCLLFWGVYGYAVFRKRSWLKRQRPDLLSGHRIKG